MDIDEFREVGDESTRDEVFDHEFNEARGGLDALEEKKGYHEPPGAECNLGERIRTPAKSSFGLMDCFLVMSCMPQQQITRRQYWNTLTRRRRGG